MKSTKVTALVAVLALSAWAALPARADTMRCGSSLISVGTAATYVIEKCGEPNSRMELSEPIRARYPNGNTYVVGTTTKEIWHYDRGRQFPANLTFEGGVLKQIDFEK